MRPVRQIRTEAAVLPIRAPQCRDVFRYFHAQPCLMPGRHTALSIGKNPVGEAGMEQAESG